MDDAGPVPILGDVEGRFGGDAQGPGLAGDDGRRPQLAPDAPAGQAFAFPFDDFSPGR